jgi:hypothetical protein
MSVRFGLMMGVHGLILILATSRDASAQLFSRHNSTAEERELRRDRRKMIGDVGGVAIGAATLNPLIAGVSAAKLGWHKIQYNKHKEQAQADAGETTAAPASAWAPGTLVAVPGRPGYFYDPANPNQLYVVPASVPDPMQARVAEPARINVRIVNQAKDGRTIRYTVSGAPYEVPPGYTQVLTTPAGSIISFERGDSAGAERFLLAEGSYEFRRVEQGWRFYATDGPAREIAEAAEKTAKGPNSPVAR